MLDFSNLLIIRKIKTGLLILAAAGSAHAEGPGVSVFLIGSAADSPIVTEQGGTEQLIGGLSVLYRFQG